MRAGTVVLVVFVHGTERRLWRSTCEVGKNALRGIERQKESGSS